MCCSRWNERRIRWQISDNRCRLSAPYGESRIIGASPPSSIIWPARRSPHCRAGLFFAPSLSKREAARRTQCQAKREQGSPGGFTLLDTRLSQFSVCGSHAGGPSGGPLESHKPQPGHWIGRAAMNSDKDAIMVEPLRIGAVSYLNTKPLIYDLEQFAPDAELILDHPSRLADDLEMGRLEVALIPIIEYFRAGTYRLVPNISIASDGPVLSVTLFSRVPWKDIRRVALDEGSRTSAALAQILIRKRYHVQPEIRPLPLDQQAENVDADAVLLIGDRAMRACLPGFAHAFDLGQEWHDWTGLPFVYAAWAVRDGVDLGPVADALVEAKRRGRERVGAISAREAPLLLLDAGFCRRYLSNIIRFDFGQREQMGLRQFYALACELGLAPSGVPVRLCETAALAAAK